jgi:hypothetical protein
MSSPLPDRLILLGLLATLVLVFAVVLISAQGPNSRQRLEWRDPPAVRPAVRPGAGLI